MEEYALGCSTKVPGKCLTWSLLCIQNGDWEKLIRRLDNERDPEYAKRKGIRERHEISTICGIGNHNRVRENRPLELVE